MTDTRARQAAAGPDVVAALRAMLDLHIAHHNNPVHVAARAALAPPPASDATPPPAGWPTLENVR